MDIRRDKALNLYDESVSVKNTKDKDSLLDNSLKNFAQIVASAGTFFRPAFVFQI